MKGGMTERWIVTTWDDNRLCSQCYLTVTWLKFSFLSFLNFLDSRVIEHFVKVLVCEMSNLIHRSSNTDALFWQVDRPPTENISIWHSGMPKALHLPSSQNTLRPFTTTFINRMENTKSSCWNRSKEVKTDSLCMIWK